MNQTIANAIHNQQTLSFTYDGHSRVVEPHTYGMTTTGKESLRAYQTQGGRASLNKHEPWHLFTVSKMIGLRCTNTGFAGPRQGYRRTDSAMRQIFAQL